MTGKKLLSVKDLAVDFAVQGEIVPALRGVSFDVGRGEALGIVGESGSGKSVACRTILRLLADNARVASGRIVLDGQDVFALKRRELETLRGKSAAMIFQNPSTHLNPLMKVGRQVAEAVLEHNQVSTNEARNQAISLLEEMGIPDAEKRADAYPHEFSGGMRQRVMVAAALACRPQLLIADEPTSALDVTTQGQLLDLLRRPKREWNFSMILISHDLGVIAQLCERTIVMRRGEIVETGPTQQILCRPKAHYTKELIASHPSLLPPVCHRVANQETGAPILAASHLSVRFPISRGPIDFIRRRPKQVVHALDDVSFALIPGESLGIVGESGSGKSTLARTLVGLVRANDGEIMFQGNQVRGQSVSERLQFRRAVQMVFQDPFTSLNPSLTVAQVLAEPLRRHRICKEGQVEKRIRELMQHVELPPDLLNRRPGQLSGGQRQRIGIARALALEPRVLIADEVTSALDVTVQATILELLKTLQRSMNLTLLLISHDISLVRHLCERVAIMRAGRVIESGNTEAIFNNPTEPYTRLLLEAIPRLPTDARD